MGIRNSGDGIGEGKFLRRDWQAGGRMASNSRKGKSLGDRLISGGKFGGRVGKWIRSV